MARIIKQGECGKNGDNLTWTLDKEGLLTISGEGEMEEYTASYSPFFYGVKYIKAVHISHGVTSIGKEALFLCYALKSIEIPNSVTTIGDGAFTLCSALTNIKIPNSVTSIGERAFSGCEALTSIEIPNSVTEIGNYTFSGCKELTNIEIPNSVTKIGENAFAGCKALTNIDVAEDNTNYSSTDGVLYDKEKKTLIKCPEGKTSIEIANSVTEIEDGVFSGCHALTNIEIPNSMTKIGENAFAGCKALTNIDVAEDNTNYSSTDGVLYDKEKKTLIKCPKGKTSIEIPNSVTNIGNSAFEGCSSLTNIEIPNSVTSIGKDAFDGCEALKYNLYDNGLYLGNKENPYAFLIKAKTKDITSCLIDEECYNIASDAFNGCWRLTNIEIPDSVTTIGSHAFSGCSALTNIETPNSVTKIGSWAFNDCRALKKIKIPNSVTEIEDFTFVWCESLTSIKIPNSVTSVGGSAFGWCKALEKIKIPNSVTYIGNVAFMQCEALESIKIPNSVTEIGGSAFWGCKALTSIDVAEDNANYTSIDGALFDKEKEKLICCPESKTTLKIPHTVTKIEDGGKSLKNIYIQCEHPELLEINEYAFREIRSKNCTLHVPAGSKERYRQHPRFRKFKKIKVKHDNLIEFIKYLIGKFI